MGYLGNRPAEAYSAFQKQDFSTSATTSYTLDHPVANQNEIALFINFVRQEPTTAYTASGTSLTLTSATSSSDDMYCVYLGKAVQTVNPPSGSVGNSQVASTIITGGGITEADMYRLTANSNDSDVTPLTAWERVDDATFSKIGTGISVSSGIFSFPSTGLYLVKVKAMTRVNTGAYDNLRLRGSNDNFSSNNDVLALQSYGVVSAGNPYQSNVLETFFNCTNVSTHKVKFDFHAQSSMDIYGDTNDNVTTIAFIRLGDSQ
jgi:hypothetical protein